MTVTIDEDPADPSVHEPRVTGSPEAIWLVYGELERDDTHANCCTEGEVTWCEDAQFAADVRYTRTDRVGELVRAAVAAERERCLGVLADTQMTAGLGKAAVHPDTGEAYYDHVALDAIIDCLSACINEIEGPNVL